MTTVMAFAVALLGALQETPAEPLAVRLVSSPKKGPGDLRGPKLREFEQRTDLAISLTRRFVAATASEKVWKELYPNLDKELAGYLKKLDQTCLEKFYAASVVELRATMRNLKGNAEAVLFADDGTCKGSIDYRTKKPTKTIHSEDFTFEAILKDVEATKRVAESEFLLWVIKDF